MWKAIITDIGRNLINKTYAGSTIKIIEVNAGTGTVTEEALPAQTDILSEKQKLKLQAVKPSGTYTNITVLLDNETVTTGYTLNQIGFYANDPDTGKILFAIAQSMDGRSIPSNSDEPYYCVTFDFNFLIETDADITAVIVDGYNFKGACLYADLPDNAVPLDFWYVSDRKENYAWNGTAWSSIGKSVEYMRFMGSCLYSDLPDNAENGDYWYCTDTNENNAWNGYEWCFVGKVENKFIFKGSCLYSALPQTAENGDYWYVSDRKEKYAWNGSAWSSIGKIEDGVYFKGSCLFAELPQTAKNGDYWYCTDKLEYYAWNGTAWYTLGSLNYTEIDELRQDLTQTNGTLSGLDSRLSESIVNISGDVSRLMINGKSYEFVQGWINAENGSLLDSPTRCRTEKCLLKANDCLTIIPNGLWFNVAIYNGNVFEGFVSNTWIENEKREFRFAESKAIIVGVRKSDNTTIAPNQVTAKAYISNEPITNELKNEIESISLLAHMDSYEERANFEQGNIQYGTGGKLDSDTRCRTSRIFIKAGFNLAVESNGMLFNVVVYNANGAYEKYLFDEWQNADSEISFDDDKIVVVITRRTDDGIIRPKDVVLNVYYLAKNFESTYSKHDCVIRNAIIENGIIVENAFGRMAVFDAEHNRNYTFIADGQFNRFIVFGAYNGGKFSEVTRLANGMRSHAELSVNNVQFDKYAVILLYDTNPTYFKADAKAYSYYANEMPVFAVNGVEVCTAEKDRYNALFATTTVDVDISEPMANLSLLATKRDNTYYADAPYGQMPVDIGYLYLDENTQKLYYSATKFDNPKYLCDWDIGLSGGKTCENYVCTITKDGDIIFLADPKYTTVRSNPIFYPHGNYENPYVIDFGTDTKPFGFVTDNSIDHCYNKDYFCYGEYREWNKADDNTMLYIWKVSAPYNTKECWKKVSSWYVRHYESGQGTHVGEEIGHIHTCLYDFYSGTWVASTGDVDYQVKVLLSTNDGETWNQVSTNGFTGQSIRTVGYVFTKDYVYYQTDSNEQHELYRCGRTNGIPNFNTLEKVCDLSGNYIAGYTTAYMRNPNGLLFLDRMEAYSGSDANKMPIEFYSFEDDKLYVLGIYQAIDGYSEYEFGIRFGLPCRAYTHYQSPYEDGIVMGTTTAWKPLLLDILGNNKHKIIGVLKLSIV